MTINPVLYTTTLLLAGIVGGIITRCILEMDCVRLKEFFKSLSLLVLVIFFIYIENSVSKNPPTFSWAAIKCAAAAAGSTISGLACINCLYRTLIWPRYKILARKTDGAPQGAAE